MRARIYNLEDELYKVRVGETAKLQLDGMLRRRDGEVSLVSARPTEPPPWAKEEAGKESRSEGLNQYYFVDILGEKPGNELKPGMTAIARKHGSRSSIGGTRREALKN